MKKSVCAWVLVSLAATLAGCLTVYTESESYTPVSSGDYSRWTGQETKAPANKTHPVTWFSVGSAGLGFVPPNASENLRAWGPLVPIIPAPGKGSDYGDDPFHILIRITPGESVVSFDPNEFSIAVDGIDSPLMPVRFENTMGDENLLHPDARYSRQWAYGTWQYYRIYFDIKIRDVKRFTLIPGTMEVDGINYVFADIDYEPSSDWDIE